MKFSILSLGLLAAAFAPAHAIISSSEIVSALELITSLTNQVSEEMNKVVANQHASDVESKVKVSWIISVVEITGRLIELQASKLTLDNMNSAYKALGKALVRFNILPPIDITLTQPMSY